MHEQTVPAFRANPDLVRASSEHPSRSGLRLDVVAAARIARWLVGTGLNSPRMNDLPIQAWWRLLAKLLALRPAG